VGRSEKKLTGVVCHGASTTCGFPIVTLIPPLCDVVILPDAWRAEGGGLGMIKGIYPTFSYLMGREPCPSSPLFPWDEATDIVSF